MRIVHSLLIALSLISSLACASPDRPVRDKEYLVLQTPQEAKTADKKIEVIEFFMYHCPACYALEPALAEWLKKQDGKVAFRRIHLPYQGADDPEAHLFLTLNALGLEKTLHEKVLHSWHVERTRLRNDEDNLAWAVKNGIAREKFLEAYRSFSVATARTRLPKLVQNYQIQNTPTFVVDGRFLSNPAMVHESNPQLGRQNVTNAAFQVLDTLVDKALKEKAR